jgi:hypothetical protein
MSITRDLPGWQLGVATAGTSVFLLLVTITGGLQAHAWTGLHSLAKGYTLGFVCLFAGLVLGSLVMDKGREAVEQRPLLLWLGYFPAALALVAGGLGLLADIFGGAGLVYNLGWILAVGVLVLGVMPVWRHALTSR